jgi:hypothetical protein
LKEVIEKIIFFYLKLEIKIIVKNNKINNNSNNCNFNKIKMI